MEVCRGGEGVPDSRGGGPRIFTWILGGVLGFFPVNQGGPRIFPVNQGGVLGFFIGNQGVL